MPLTHLGRKNTARTAAVAAVMRLDQDSLMELIPLQVGFEFSFPFPRLVAIIEQESSVCLLLKPERSGEVDLCLLKKKLHEVVETESKELEFDSPVTILHWKR